MSFFISIVLVELLLRYISPVDISNSFKHRIPHPEFGWVLAPNASYLNKMPEDTVRVTYNSAGWRDVEHSFKNNHGLFRVLVLGDSFMEGYSVELGDMFHRQIKQLADKENLDIEAINLGVGGYGTLQEYLVFRDIGQNYKPNIVLLGFYIGNDVKNNSFYLETGYLPNTKPIQAKGLKESSRPFLDPSDKTTWTISRVDYEGAWRRYSTAKARLAEEAQSESLVKKLVRQSALIQASLHAVKQIKTVDRNSDHAIRDHNGNKAKKKGFAVFGANYCQEHPEYTAAWLTTKRILDRLKNDVSSTGGELIVFTVPAQHEVLEEEIRNIPNRELLCWEDAPAYNRLKGILNELDIGYIDLLPSFRTISRNDNQNLFRRSDRHWNENGHLLAAEVVYSALKDRGLLPLTETNHSAQQNNFPANHQRGK